MYIYIYINYWAPGGTPAGIRDPGRVGPKPGGIRAKWDPGRNPGRAGTRAGWDPGWEDPGRWGPRPWRWTAGNCP